MPRENDASIGDQRTFSDAIDSDEAANSLGAENTLGGFVTTPSSDGIVIDEIHPVDLETRYRLERRLGEGGMGEVFLAVDTRLGRRVALKRIRQEKSAANPAFARFLQEAKTVASLNHPNIIQIYDYGQASDGPFIVLEYAAGGSLASRITDRPIEPSEAVHFICQICDGLHAAHAAGIIHRDIKPANILISADGLPKLADFGLALNESKIAMANGNRAVVGTPAYMPPEQSSHSGVVDARTDIWSLAASLYEMVTGKNPRVVRLELLPQPLQTVVAKALEDEKSLRYQSVLEFMEALQGVLSIFPDSRKKQIAGECPECGTVNSQDRQYCSQCAELIIAPCLGCASLVPVWEPICGSCGANQAKLAEPEIQKNEAIMQHAQAYLSDLDFENAKSTSEKLLNLSHPLFRHAAKWAKLFLQEVDNKKQWHQTVVSACIEEARKNEDAHDYHAALAALLRVPTAMRSHGFVGSDETIEDALQRLQGIINEVKSLTEQVRDGVKRKRLDGLHDCSNRLATLCPHRPDVQHANKVISRHHKRLCERRDQQCKQAAALLATYRYDEAIALLSGVPLPVVDDRVVQLREQAHAIASRSATLKQIIDSAFSSGEVSEVKDALTEYIRLNPRDAVAATRKEAIDRLLESRKRKFDSRVGKARKKMASGDFQNASMIYERLLHEANDSSIVHSVRLCRKYEARQREALDALEKAIRDVSREPPLVLDYLKKAEASGIHDDIVFASLNVLRDARKKRRKRFEKLLVGSCVCIFLFGAFSVWRVVQSYDRTQRVLNERDAATVSEPILGKGKDEEIVEAALEMLADTPPRVTEAIELLDTVEEAYREDEMYRKAKASAYISRAQEFAANGRIVEAYEDIQVATLIAPSAAEECSASAVVLDAFLAQADTAIEEGDADQLKLLLDRASSLGAESSRLAVFWQRLAEKAAMASDGVQLALAIDEGKTFGLSDRVIKGLWRICARASYEARDFGALSFASSELVSLGLGGEELREWWLEIGFFAEDANDLELLREATEYAKMFGADDRRVNELRTRYLLGKASEAVVNGGDVSHWVSAAASVSLQQTSHDLKDTKYSPVLNYLSRRFEGAFREALLNQDVGQVSRISANCPAIESSAMCSGFRIACSEISDLRLSLRDFLLLPGMLRSELPSEIVSNLGLFRGSEGLFFSLIPSGTFTMGSPTGSSVERPSHKVTISKEFMLGVFEVTNAEKAGVLGGEPPSFVAADCPAEVTWFEATRFCSELSNMSSSKAFGHVYRLPTEAEWEYACRAGSDLRFSFGHRPPDLVDYGWFDDNSEGRVHRVGAKRPNAFGLYDMHGNVREWCSDWLGDYELDDVTDPIGASEGANRVLRGGGWNDAAHFCRSTMRFGENPGVRAAGNGFRVVLEIGEETSE